MGWPPAPCVVLCGAGVLCWITFLSFSSFSECCYLGHTHTLVAGVPRTPLPSNSGSTM